MAPTLNRSYPFSNTALRPDWPNPWSKTVCVIQFGASLHLPSIFLYWITCLGGYTESLAIYPGNNGGKTILQQRLSSQAVPIPEISDLATKMVTTASTCWVWICSRPVGTWRCFAKSEPFLSFLFFSFFFFFDDS
jgi:hypothetical protein